MKISGSVEFTIIERTAEKVVSEMPVTTGNKNPYGVVNAGAIMWFADVTASLLVIGRTRVSEGMKGFPLAIGLNAHFLSNQSDGSFKATSVFVKKSKTVNVVRTTVVGENEKVVADVTTSHVQSR